ncbi:LytTR family DNA-binding domain-containing protein [uncultured Draconibacterium sp.]|uniref:LytR/AlgR family response regulator transcription factor n=1 Tax=uncultured Draconibacterium sp. TaxID=1573823 RepID=UPI003217069A
MQLKKSFLKQNIPFTSNQGQIINGSVFGILVFFILVVFQPFGTQSFSIQFKSFFLFGYGFITALSFALFYIAGSKWLTKWFNPQNWTVLKECVSFIVLFNFMTILCLVYHQQLIGGYSITWIVYFHFFKYSVAVGTLPFLIIFYHKFISRRENITIEKTVNTKKPQLITFESSNKTEKSLILAENEILYLKSDGNYVEVYSCSNSKLNKHLIRNTLNTMISQLPAENFLKIHRSFVANLNFAEQIGLNGSTYELTLANNIKLPVSRTLAKTLKQKLV